MSIYTGAFFPKSTPQESLEFPSGDYQYNPGKHKHHPELFPCLAHAPVITTIDFQPFHPNSRRWQKKSAFPSPPAIPQPNHIISTSIPHRITNL